jgi:nicotinamide-nucleotide amidase
MVLGALRESGAHFGLAISGVAGPGGGTPQKPVGTVCIAVAKAPNSAQDSAAEPLVRTFNFPGDREMIRDRAAKTALSMLRFHLLGKDLPF